MFEFLKLSAQGVVAPNARDGHAATVLGLRALLVFGGVTETSQNKSDDDDDDDDDDDGIVRHTDQENGDDDIDEDESPLRELNDLWQFDFASATWSQLAMAGDVPTPRTGSVMFRGASADVVFVFGGFSQQSGWSSELFRADLQAKRWTRIGDGDDDLGDVPTCRDKIASATGADGRVWLYGGFGPLVDEAGDDGFGDGQTFKWFDDLFVFDPARQRFTRVPCTNAEPRCAAAAAVVGSELLVFGGSFSRDPAKRSDELRALTLPAAGAESAQPSEWRVIAAANAPSGRSFVSAANVGGSFVVFGGKGRQDQPLGDGGVFCNGAWAPLAPLTERPSARQYAQLVVREDQTHALLYGGSGVALGNEVRLGDLWILRAKP
jgi:hypothetical protein